MENKTPAFSRWPDLPESLAELVLERLPLVSYIRFAAVCPQWRSIQRGHRLRHAPHPPPMANQIPWLVSLRLNPQRELEFYSPSDRKSHRLPVPSSLRNPRCLASCRGWLLLIEGIHGYTPNLASKPTFLVNPVTAVQIPLPPPSLIRGTCGVVGALSAPPTDPNCTVLLVFDFCAFFYRPNDHCATDWTAVQLAPVNRVFSGSAIYCGDKFYYTCNGGYQLYVIDPFLQKATASASLLVMRDPPTCNKVSLQEICGELFSVQITYTSFRSDVIKEFQVFKADLSGKEWVTVETLGDHALFHDDDCSVFLLAADVGCKRNSIYACKGFRPDVKSENDVFAWGSVNLGTGNWTEEDTLMTHGVFGPWFLPTLDSASPAKASIELYRDEGNLREPLLAEEEEEEPGYLKVTPYSEAGPLTLGLTFFWQLVQRGLLSYTTFVYWHRRIGQRPVLRY